MLLEFLIGQWRTHFLEFCTLFGFWAQNANIYGCLLGWACMCACCTDHFSCRAIDSDTGAQIAVVHLSEQTKTNGPTHTKNENSNELKHLSVLWHFFLSFSSSNPAKCSKRILTTRNTHFTENKNPFYIITANVECESHRHCRIVSHAHFSFQWAGIPLKQFWSISTELIIGDIWIPKGRSNFHFRFSTVKCGECWRIGWLRKNLEIWLFGTFFNWINTIDPKKGSNPRGFTIVNFFKIKISFRQIEVHSIKLFCWLFWLMVIVRFIYILI